MPRCRARGPKSKMGRVMPVSMRPGQMAFTRTPVPTSALAAVWTRLITPALLAEYGLPPALARSAATDAVQTMEPPPCRIMTGAACLMMQPGSDEVDAQDLLPLGHRLLEERDAPAAHPGIGEDHVDAAPLRHAARRPRPPPPSRRRRRRRGPGRLPAAAVSVTAASSSAAARSTASTRAPSRTKSWRAGAADAARRAGDDRPLAGEPAVASRPASLRSEPTIVSARLAFGCGSPISCARRGWPCAMSRAPS